MSSCPQCGNPIPEGSRFCPECGAPAPMQDAHARNTTPPSSSGFGSSTPSPANASSPYPTTPPTAPDSAFTPIPSTPSMSTMTNPPQYSSQPVFQPPLQPIYTLAYDGTEPPPPGTPYSALTVKDVFIVLLVFSIPAIGWIICIAWALGATKNQNKRSLARGFLLYSFVAFLVATLLIGIAWWMFDLESVFEEFQYYNYYGQARFIVRNLYQAFTSML